MPKIRIVDFQICVSFVRDERTFTETVTPVDYRVFSDAWVLFKNFVNVFFEEFVRLLILFFLVDKSENPFF